MSATAQELVERALAASAADDCIVIVHDTTSANLRWANNTLTTNGQMSGRSATVVSFVASADGIAAGSTSGSPTTLDEMTAIVSAAVNCITRFMSSNLLNVKLGPQRELQYSYAEGAELGNAEGAEVRTLTRRDRREKKDTTRHLRLSRIQMSSACSAPLCVLCVEEVGDD